MISKWALAEKLGHFWYWKRQVNQSKSEQDFSPEILRKNLWAELIAELPVDLQACLD